MAVSAAVPKIKTVLIFLFSHSVSFSSKSSVFSAESCTFSASSQYFVLQKRVKVPPYNIPLTSFMLCYKAVDLLACSAVVCNNATLLRLEIVAKNLLPLVAPMTFLSLLQA